MGIVLGRESKEEVAQLRDAAPMKREVEPFDGEDVCSGCGARVIWARVDNSQVVPVDAEQREDGRVVLVHRVVSEPPCPYVWQLSDAALEDFRDQHRNRVRKGTEEPGPFKLFGFHDCRQTQVCAAHGQPGHDCEDLGG